MADTDTPRAKPKATTTRTAPTATDIRQPKLAKQAGALGLRLEHDSVGFRLVDPATGTLVAADWSTVEGYGLTLDDVETALAVAGGTAPADTDP